MRGTTGGRSFRSCGQEGIDPFPHEFPRVVPSARIREAHADLADGEETDFAYRVAGRIHARRGHGKAAFIDLDDRSGRIQLHARADVLGDESHERLLSLDLGDLIGVDGTAFKTRRGELSLRIDSWQLLAKSLRSPPEKFHGLEDVETRYRHRELDLIANEEVRDLFILRSKVIASHPPLARLARLSRGRDARAPAALRRRARAAVHHAPQRARQGPLSADRHRAVPQAPDRGRPRARLRAGQGLPQRGDLVQAQPRVHDARVVRGLRGLPPDRGGARGAGRDGRARRRLRRRDRLQPALAPRHPAGCDPRRDRPRRARAARPRRARGRGEGEGHRARPDRRLAADRGRAAVEARRAEARPADVRHGLPEGAVAVREGPPLRAGPRGAVRVLRRRDGVRERVHRAQRPGRAARSASRTSSASPRRATRRRSPTTRTSSRRSSTACRRPAGSAWGSTGS